MTRPWTELTVASFRQRWDRLRVALTKIESGEVGKMDGTGSFVCAVCGCTGIPLDSIVNHDERGRKKKSTHSLPVQTR